MGIAFCEVRSTECSKSELHALSLGESDQGVLGETPPVLRTSTVSSSTRRIKINGPPDLLEGDAGLAQAAAWTNVKKDGWASDRNHTSRPRGWMKKGQMSKRLVFRRSYGDRNEDGKVLAGAHVWAATLHPRWLSSSFSLVLSLHSKNR